MSKSCSQNDMFDTNQSKTICFRINTISRLNSRNDSLKTG